MTVNEPVSALWPAWISVSDRLPEEGILVLALDRWRHVSDRRFCRLPYEDKPRFRPGGLEAKKDVTHWMPMPPAVESERSTEAMANADGSRGSLWPAWISVSDRLPEEGILVLTRDLWGHVKDRSLYITRDEVPLIFRPDGLEAKKDITHWMPLPPALEVR